MFRPYSNQIFLSTVHVQFLKIFYHFIMAIEVQNAIYSRSYELQDVHLANDSPS